MPERPRTINRIAAGAASGAMGTVALNAATYADIAIRGRAPSTVPEGTVQAMADTVGADLAGDGGKRAAEHRRTASASCSVTVPALPSARSMERCDLRSHSSASRSPDSLSASVAMIGANAGAVAAGTTDPRRRDVKGWPADVVPHVCFGLATAAAFDTLRGNGAEDDG